MAYFWTFLLIAAMVIPTEINARRNNQRNDDDNNDDDSGGNNNEDDSDETEDRNNNGGMEESENNESGRNGRGNRNNRNRNENGESDDSDESSGSEESSGSNESSESDESGGRRNRGRNRNGMGRRRGRGRRGREDCDSCGENAECNKRGQCQCNSGYHGDGYECSKGCVCTASGDPHIIRFDDEKHIDFQGYCAYTYSMIDESDRPECNYRVILRQRHPPGKLHVTVTVMVMVILSNGETIQMGPRNYDDERQVLINGVLSEAYYVAGDNSTLEVINGKYTVTTPCNVIVTYDLKHRMAIFVPDELGSDISGLCGNCDGIQNDCHGPGNNTSYLDTEGECIVPDYGSSWATYDPDYPDCVDILEDIQDMCATTESKDTAHELCSRLDFGNDLNEFRKEFEAYNPQMTRDQKAKAKVVVDNLLEECEYDVCAALDLGEEADETVCEYMEILASDMALNGLCVPCFRSPSFCPSKCRQNERFYQNMTVPEMACYGLESTVLGPLNEECGCACEEGYVRSGNDCVQESECGCFEEETEKYYKLGDEFLTQNCEGVVCELNEKGEPNLRLTYIVDCARNASCQLNPSSGKYGCMCNPGYVSDGGECKPACGERDRPCHQDAECKVVNGDTQCVCEEGLEGDGVFHCGKMCRCEVWNGPFYKPFESLPFVFNGPCMYTLTNIDDPKCGVDMTIKNSNDELTGLISRTLFVTFPDGTMVTMASGNKLFVNDQFQATGSYKNKYFSVRFDGKYLVMNTHCGIRAGYHDQMVYVEVPQRYGETATGICGQCDGNPYIWRTKEGQDVSGLSDKVSRVLNSFLVPSESGFDEEKCKVYTEPSPPDCDEEVQAKAKAKCGALVNMDQGPFSEVLRIDEGNFEYAINVANACVDNYCRHVANPDEQTKAGCQAYGIIHDRLIRHYDVPPSGIEQFCPADPNHGCDPALNMTYSPAVFDCLPTCLEPDGPKNCQQEVTSGCKCTEKYMFYENGKCILPTDCGYTRRIRTEDGFDYEYHPVGETFVTPDCKQRFTIEKRKNAPKIKKERLKKCDKKTETCGKVTPELYGCVCNEGLVRVDGECVVDVPKETESPSSPRNNELPGFPSVPENEEPKPPSVPENEEPKPPSVPENEEPKPPSVPENEEPKPPSVPENEEPKPPSVPENEEPKPPSVPENEEPKPPSVPENEEPKPPSVPENEEPKPPSVPEKEAPNPPSEPGNEKPEEVPVPCEEEEPEEKFDFPLVIPTGPHVVNCIQRDDPKGYRYSGNISRTIDGIECQPWKSMSPHRHEFTAVPGNVENFCRNRPSKGKKGLNDLGPWCFTTDPEIRYQQCAIPSCKTDAQEDGQEEAPPSTEPLSEKEIKCYNSSDKGVSYDGKLFYTNTGAKCDYWKDVHERFSHIDHNYCRNFEEDDRDMPYCYVNKVKRKCLGLKKCYEEEETEEEKESPPECTVKTSVKLCGTETTFTGSCGMTFDHPDECAFKLNRVSKTKYDIHMPVEEQMIQLKLGVKDKFISPKCGTFEIIAPNKVKLTSPTCGMCMRSSYKNIMPDENAYSVHPGRLFCNSP